MDRREFVLDALQAAAVSLALRPASFFSSPAKIPTMHGVLGANSRPRSACPKIATTAPHLWATDDLPANIENVPAQDPIAYTAMAGSYQRLSANRFRVEAPNFQAAEAEQEEADYCWAAVVESVLGYSHISIDQDAIVQAVQGNKTGGGASLGQIVCAMNGVLPTTLNRPAFISATPFTNIAQVLTSLARAHPVIVGMGSRENKFGHVYALTAIEYCYAPRTFVGVVPNIFEADVFDPLPDHGDETLDGSEFASSIRFAIVFEVVYG